MRFSTGVLSGVVSSSLALLGACNLNPTGADACGNIAAKALSAGETAVLTGGSVCVVGTSATSQYALVAYNSAATGGANSSVAVQPTNNTTITNVLASVQSLETTQQFATLSTQRSDAFHGKLRDLERRTLKSRIPAAREWLASRAISRGLAPTLAPAALAVGDMVSLNTNTNDACATPQRRSAVVTAIGTRSIVIADPNNPAGGFTDAEYQSIAATFDTLIDPLVTSTFGAPSDIDQNGKVMLFFTAAVNQLTPAHSDFFIGGFFFARDLFPTTASGSLPACPGSNYGEMFYLIVPDPNGTLGNTYTKSFVLGNAPALLVHEYQHLVNASRRIYVNNAPDLEDTWVDEGLSHSSEELLFYRQSGLTPRSNIGPTTLRSSNNYVQAFNSDVAGNFGSLIDFLKSPSNNSPYADNDSLATRGSTWSFLRYAVDRQGSSDGNAWSRLTNSVTTGRATLANVFGSDLAGLFRDWGVSLIGDDVSGADAAYQQRSWQYRALIAALQNDGTYPLNLVPLTAGVQTTTTLVPGGDVYYPFAVGNTAATLTWTAGSETLFVLIRLK